MADRDPAATEADDAPSFARLLLKRGVDATQLSADATGTVYAKTQASNPNGGGGDDVGALPLLVGDDADLALGASIGDGGMGIVRSARQRALGREVAVKCARGGEDVERHDDVAAVIREARVTGSLEHPNIVPVYALGRAQSGEALLVMKRIEGSAWSALLAKRASRIDDLKRHVEILIDVCRAMSFAHARGVVHRDLKPANVMVGAFGEVYVLDWGIAVPLGTRPESVCGTPAYMAPEMAAPGDAPFDARTDVYLLGAMLHVVLAGNAPHSGADINAILFHAWKSPTPSFAADIPDELAAVCRRAMARAPADRFESATALREALAAFLEHAAARALYAQAERQLAALTALVHANDHGGVDGVDGGGGGGGDVDEGATYRAYSASRFGFEQALREWPGFVDARAALTKTIVALSRWEIRRRRADSARALLAELDVRDAAIDAELAALDAAVVAERAERTRLEAIARAYEVGLGGRRFVFAYLAVIAPWLAFAFFAGHSMRAGVTVITPSQMAGTNSAIAIGFGAVAFFLKKRTGHTLLTKLATLSVAAQLGLVAVWLSIDALGAAFAVGTFVGHVFLALIIVAASVFIRPAQAFALIPTVLSLPALVLWPTWSFEVNGVTLVAALLVLAATWPRDVGPPR